MNIYQKIAEVMKDPSIGYIKKDKMVGDEKYGYKAITHDNVTAHVRPLFIKHGIVMTASLIEGKSVDTGKVHGAKAIPVVRFEGIYEVSFVNIDDPGDRIIERMVGHAEDAGDKAPGKALSYAVKGGVLKLLMIETGENDESRVQNGDVKLESKLVADLKADMDSAIDKAQLREKVKKALTIANDCGDTDAFEEFRVHSKTIADKLDAKKEKAAA